MSDLEVLTTVVSNIKTASEIAKNLISAKGALSSAEDKMKVAELVEALAEAKMQTAEFKEILIRKDQIIRELQHSLETEKKVVWEKPYYWVENDDGRDGPYCQRCKDVEGVLVRLQSRMQGSWRCLSCGHTVEDSSYRPPQVITNSGPGFM